MEQWIPLRTLKETNPIEVAEYAVSRGINNEAAFHWWVPYTLREHDRIIAGVNVRVKKTTHKYGIQFPRTVEEARLIDKITGTTHWNDALQLEMANVIVTFEILDSDQPIPIRWT